MQLAIIGTGYVGLVTGACLAEKGNHVTCVDTDAQKLADLKRGQVPIHEPSLDALVRLNSEAGRLNFTDDLAAAVQDAEVVFIAVGTPPNEDGSTDLNHVLAAAQAIGQVITRPIVVAGKSTVPVGTADQVRQTIEAALNSRNAKVAFDVVSNPEFLSEGSAVENFMQPDRIVIGTDGGGVTGTVKQVMKDLYATFVKEQEQLQFVGIRDAEMIKYAANAMLATRISFMNEVALMCDEYGADVDKVRLGIGSDPRIGPAFIYPGCGYGGSCFPKDVRAMIKMAEKAGLQKTVFEAVESRNEQQQLLLVEKVVDRFGENLTGKTFALWGLAFKPETDDVRGAPAITITRALCELGARVHAWDPQAASVASKELTGLAVDYADDPYLATEGADALLVVTEWQQIRQPDFKRLSEQLKSRIVLDGRNIYSPQMCADCGLDCIGIGRSSALVQKP